MALKLLERRQRDRYAPKIINQREGNMTVGYPEIESDQRPDEIAEQAKKLAEGEK